MAVSFKLLMVLQLKVHPAAVSSQLISPTPTLKPACMSWFLLSCPEHLPGSSVGWCHPGKTLESLSSRNPSSATLLPSVSSVSIQTHDPDLG